MNHTLEVVSCLDLFFFVVVVDFPFFPPFSISAPVTRCMLHAERLEASLRRRVPRRLLLPGLFFFFSFRFSSGIQAYVPFLFPLSFFRLLLLKTLNNDAKGSCVATMLPLLALTVLTCTSRESFSVCLCVFSRLLSFPAWMPRSNDLVPARHAPWQVCIVMFLPRLCSCSFAVHSHRNHKIITTKKNAKIEGCSSARAGKKGKSPIGAAECLMLASPAGPGQEKRLKLACTASVLKPHQATYKVDVMMSVCHHTRRCPSRRASSSVPSSVIIRSARESRSPASSSSIFSLGGWLLSSASSNQS